MLFIFASAAQFILRYHDIDYIANALIIENMF